MIWITCFSCLLLSLALGVSLGGPPSSSGDAPLTTPEASEWQRTSTAAQVRAFVASLRGLEHADRLAERVIGRTEEGREILLVTVADPMPEPGARAEDGRLRLLINANIHAGEVEGKEAAQQLLREFATGEHAALLEGAVLLFVPIYNVDGNERIERAHRFSQNGPDGGVGLRPNAHGLDLNRDFVKVESAECRALLGLVREQDPHLFLDLHTTNGSYHGYHLTYSPSLSTNVDAELDRFEREQLLPGVRADLLANGGWRVFDYGNFGEDGQHGEQLERPLSWSTYDHRPRFGTNYYSLRNRLAVLSEAYSYLDFESRTQVTRAFTLSVLARCVEHRERVLELCAAADRAASAARQGFPYRTSLAPAEPGQVLVGAVDELEIEGIGTRLIARPEYTSEAAGIQRRFHSEARLELPAGWALVSPSAALLDVLRAHGLELRQLEAETELELESFLLERVARAERPFQGHHELSFVGAWQEPSRRKLAAGSWIVPAEQRLSRVAAQLLEPASEDSLGTWGLLIPEAAGEDAAGSPPSYPVLRLRELP